MQDILAQPIQLGHHRAKNRIFMPPMLRPWSDDSGKVSDRHISHYQGRAEGGVGTIVIESTAVLQEYRLSEKNIGIWSDEHIDGLSQMAKAILEKDVLAFIQINHTAANRALSKDEITTARNAFVDAAVRAEKAGFQGVEIHAAHGYQLSRLLSSNHNQQDDEYGGSIDGRLRLLFEIISLVREKTKSDLALGVRLGIDSLEDGIEFAKKLSPLVDYLSISRGAGDVDAISTPPNYPFSPLVYRAEQVKPYVTVPVVAVGGINTGAIARQILLKGIADLIAVGKGMLDDPRWAEKALSDRDDEIQPFRN